MMMSEKGVNPHADTGEGPKGREVFENGGLRRIYPRKTRIGPSGPIKTFTPSRLEIKTGQIPVTNCLGRIAGDAELRTAPTILTAP